MLVPVFFKEMKKNLRALGKKDKISSDVYFAQT
jgi:hypothetical protein